MNGKRLRSKKADGPVEGILATLSRAARAAARSSRAFLFTVTLPALVLACAPLQQDMTPPPGSPTPSPSPAVPPESRAAVELAHDDLAAQLGIPREQVQVLSVAPVTWSDTSLGCPQPGMVYAQVLVPGYLVVLSDGQQRYAYHTDSGRRAVRCGEA
jgi:hypothetical protein